MEKPTRPPKQNKNKENLDLYKKTVSSAPVNKESLPTLDALALEGNILLEEDGKVIETKVKAIKETNPYVKAKLQLLAKYPLWKQEMLATIEKNNNFEHRMWSEFCLDIRRLGDELS